MKSSILGVVMQLVSLSFLVCAGTVRAQPDEVIQAIDSTWQARATKVSSLRIEWEETVLTKKGGLTAEMGIRNRQKEILPIADSTHVGAYVLFLDNDKMRCDVRSSVFSAVSESWVALNQTAIFDGQRGLSYEDQPELPFKTAEREVGEIPGVFRGTTMFPPLLAARPMLRRLNPIKLDDYRYSGRNQSIRDEACLELVLRKQVPSAAISIWVNPKQDYAVIRRQMSSIQNGKIKWTLQDDIQYKEAVKGLWLPSSWTIVRLDSNSNVTSSIKALVGKIELDIRNPASRFSTDPPSKSLLSDTDAERKTTESVIRQDGSDVALTVSNRKDAIVELVGRAPEPSATSWQSRNLYLLIFLLAITLISFVLVIQVRARLRKRRGLT